jgi:hypothetical protein
MQTGLDHIILGIDNLDRGIEWVEERTGVRAAFGGVHPGRGTRNALLALGPDCYLEIIAPDPAQSAPVWFSQILSVSTPKLITWAVHSPDLTALAQSAESAGMAIDGPHIGARSRPDGRVLSWNLFGLRDDCGGLLPFFIEWGHDSVHPSTDAPAGCRLTSFHLQSPDANVLARMCRTLGIDVSVEPAEEPRLVALIASPGGEVRFVS